MINMAYSEVSFGRDGKIIVVSNPNNKYHKNKITIIAGTFKETKSELEYRLERKNKK